ncbi:MAG: EAL domain-containing protein [Pseudomonadota bacterium]
MKVLLVEDVDSDAELTTRALMKAFGSAPELSRASTLTQARTLLTAREVDVVLLDLSLPDAKALDGLHSLVSIDPLVPIVIVSNKQDEECALSAVRAGAEDFLVKHRESPEHLRRAIHHAMERKRTTRRLHDMASLDELTGLANRATFNERVEQAVGRATRNNGRFALLFMDLDGFKGINDAYGHQIGDTILREVAARLSRQLRRDDLVARIGGDEFCVIVEGLQREDDARLIAENLSTIADRPVVVGNDRISFGLSTGVSIYPDHGTSPEALLRHSDQAMYRAKSQGGNSYSVFRGNGPPSPEAALQREFEESLSNGALQLRFQPIVETGSLRIKRFEALVRWRHPRLGLQHPGKFLGMVRRRNLGPRLDHFVVATACDAAARWNEAGIIDCPIAINIGSESVNAGSLEHLVGECLTASKCPADLLEIELSERALIADPARTQSVIESLRAMGVRICIDDMGTTMTSLAYLRHLPIDSLKIDRMYLSGLDNSYTRSIVRAIIGLGRSMRVKVVAQGVQTRAQHQFAVENRCDQMQGYRFGMPMTAAQMEQRSPVAMITAPLGAPSAGVTAVASSSALRH